jgi:hypothetical protein
MTRWGNGYIICLDEADYKNVQNENGFTFEKTIG